MKKLRLLILLTASMMFASCAMKSGYYTQKNGKWTFVSKKVGFSNYFSNPRVDDTNFNYKDSGKFRWPVPSSKRISSYLTSWSLFTLRSKKISIIWLRGSSKYEFVRLSKLI